MKQIYQRQKYNHSKKCTSCSIKWLIIWLQKNIFLTKKCSRYCINVKNTIKDGYRHNYIWLAFLSTIYFWFSEQNQLVLIRQRFANDLLNILSRLELLAEPGRNLIKIAGAILSVCLHLVPSSKYLEIIQMSYVWQITWFITM